MKNKRKDKNIKRGKILNFTSSLSGAMGFLGGYQICHNVCLGIIALLSIIGITLVGMPLLFLTKVAIPFWIAAFFLFLISLFFYFRNKCISKNLLLFNGGIIIAGVPFNFMKDFFVYLWIIGGGIVLLSILFFIKDKIKNNKKYFQCEECKLKYKEKKWAEKCEFWCKKYKSCNLKIIKHANGFFFLKKKSYNVKEN